MSEKQNLPVIEYFSDVLCVWAWVSQARLEALRKEFAGRVVLRQRFLDVFGNAHEKIRAQWAAKGGFEAFGEHVQKAGAGFPEISLSPSLWSGVTPSSSLPAHQWILAVEGAAGEESALSFAREVREAFFSNGLDIAEADVLRTLAQGMALPLQDIEAQLSSGQALAAVAADQKAANAAGLRGSPSWLMNDGRQLLYGNVGYRILAANVEALLQREQPGASWC